MLYKVPQAITFSGFAESNKPPGQETIADALGVTQQTIANWLTNFTTRRN
jgi:hypothetical protein